MSEQLKTKNPRVESALGNSIHTKLWCCYNWSLVCSLNGKNNYVDFDGLVKRILWCISKFKASLPIVMTIL